MIPSTICARQPHRQAWTCEHLLQEHAITLGQAIDNSTWKNYRSILNSYLNFIKLHDFPFKPTTNMLSIFTVYMCHHIKPGSVATYLSGICQQLEPYFPKIAQLATLLLYIIHCGVASAYAQPQLLTSTPLLWETLKQL